MHRLDFENLATKLSQTVNKNVEKVSDFARCDWVEIKEKEIVFIEETNLSRKDLFQPKKFSKEVIENIKKMWGSLVVFAILINDRKVLCKVSRDKKRIYLIVFPKIDGRSARSVANIMKTLEKFRDGGISEVKFANR